MFIFRHLFSIIFALSCFGPLAFAASLHREEEVTLKQIVESMGAKPLNLDVDQCQSKTLVITPKPIYGDPNGTIHCDCHFDNHTVCHITALILKSFNLPGRLPPKLANLPYLETVDFTRNYLEGTIPLEWTSLQFLKSISLTANRLSGKFPEALRRMTNLTYLSLEANQFSGTIPNALGDLVKLTDLILSSNQFEGNLPNTLAELKNLTNVRMSDNSFKGTIPDFIGSWTQLERLELYGSGLEGPIPKGISRLEKLKDLRITDLTGTEFAFPDLPNRNNLKQLVLRNLNLSGKIPPYIWTLSSLKMLDVSFNRLEGEISIRKKLQWTFLSGNMLTGNVPDSVLSAAKNLDLSYNDFTWSSNCSKITLGNINLYRSSSSKNTLNGLLPCSDRSKCEKYSESLHINCGGKDLIIKNKYGKILYEGDQDIQGGAAAKNYISKTNWGFSSTGDFMDDNGDFDNKYTVSTGSTKLELKDTARIAPISLIYYGFCLKNGTYYVKLHFAEIQFKDNLVGRRIFDIYIQGRLVWKDFNIQNETNGNGKEVIKPFNATVVDNFLEIRLYWAGKGTTCIPARGNYGPLISAISVCHSSKSHCEESEDPSKIPVVVGVVSLVLCVILLVLGYLCWQRYFSGDKDIDFKGLDLQTGSFTLRQIKAATNNFDPVNKIGEGGFGSVYKGQLSDGTVIAVKQLSSKSKQGNREFVNEIGMISGLQHPNLVKLYGCCIEGNQLLLVYEYMENNCLARALFNKQETNGLTLDWTTRFKVCLGIARGLAFLHEESMLKIVHRDIKATNILLDINLNAKISDFGLAKLNEEENTHISTRVAGTIGYMAPEYALWGYLIDKADVYSFGVVALEIVSGKNNTSYRPENECVCLLDWAFVLQRKGSLMEIVDLKLGSEFNREETERMIKVALLCTNASPSLRPNMSEVVSMLDGQMMVHEVISDLGIYGDDLRFKPLRDHYQQMMYQNSSGNKAPNYSSDGPWVGSSSTSAQDLYQVNPDSIPSTSANDLYQVNPDSTDFKVSETSSLVSRHSN